MSGLDIGTLVYAWPGVKQGQAHIGRIRSKVWEVGGQRVVLVEGLAGGIALTHIELAPPLPADRPATNGDAS